MNGFLEMAMQAAVEDFVTEMDTEFDQEIDRDKGEIVMGLLKDTLVAMHFDSTAHPVEHAAEQVVRAIATMYMLLQVGPPSVVGLLGKNLIMAAFEFNENAKPIVTRMKKEMVGE